MRRKRRRLPWGKATPPLTVMERPWVEEKEAVLETEVEVPTVKEREEEIEDPVTIRPARAKDPTRILFLTNYEHTTEAHHHPRHK